jgi:hypothetical protein
MYKPPQAKRSSWSPVSTQRQSKVQAKPSWLPVPPKQQEGDAQASELPSYSPEAFDLMAAKTIRSIEAKEQRQQDAQTPKLIQRQCGVNQSRTYAQPLFVAYISGK